MSSAILFPCGALLPSNLLQFGIIQEVMLVIERTIIHKLDRFLTVKVKEVAYVPSNIEDNPLFLCADIVNMTNTSLMQHNLKRFSHIFTVEVASHIRSISMDGEGLPLAKRMNLGMSFSGNWFGPYSLLPRVVMTGNPYERPYAITSISAPALVAK
jgi:hypothetical protein